MGLRFENQKELKPKPSRCSSQKLVSGSVGNGDESKAALAVVSDEVCRPPNCILVLQRWSLAKGLIIESFLLEGSVLEHGEKSYVSFCNCLVELQLATIGCRGISSKKHDGKGAQDHVGPSTTCRLWVSSLS